MHLSVPVSVQKRVQNHMSRLIYRKATRFESNFDLFWDHFPSGSGALLGPNGPFIGYICPICGPFWTPTGQVLHRMLLPWFRDVRRSYINCITCCINGFVLSRYLLRTVCVLHVTLTCFVLFPVHFCTEKGPKTHVTFDLRQGKTLRERFRPVLGPFPFRNWTHQESIYTPK